MGLPAEITRRVVLATLAIAYAACSSEASSGGAAGRGGPRGDGGSGGVGGDASGDGGAGGAGSRVTARVGGDASGDGGAGGGHAGRGGAAGGSGSAHGTSGIAEPSQGGGDSGVSGDPTPWSGRGGASSGGNASPSFGGNAVSTAPTGLPAKCAGVTCNAATPSNPQPTDYGGLGNITEYTTSASNGGACLYGATNVVYFAAIHVNLVPGDGKGLWQGGQFCGQCLEVTALTSQGPKAVVVRVMDKCPDASCGVDLGGSAPAAIMADGFGRYDGAWRIVSCAGHAEVFDGSPSLYVKDGANPYWSVVQIRNPMAAVKAVDWQNRSVSSQKGTLSWSASIENYLTVPAELLSANASFDFTIRYVDGTSGKVALTSAQLGTASSSYPLE